METAADLVRQAQELEVSGKFSQAIEKFYQAAEADPNRLDAYSGAGRCAESAPPAYFKAQAPKTTAVPVPEAMRAMRDTEISINDSRLNEYFLAAVSSLQKKLMEQNERLKGLKVLKSLMDKNGIDPSIWLEDDEVRLLAGVRILKQYGFATTKLNIEHRKCCDIKVEVVRNDFSKNKFDSAAKNMIN